MSSDAEKREKIAALLNEAWREYRGEIEQRVDLLRTAVEEAKRGELSEPARAAANSSAHKLAGVLGTFGLRDASRSAIEVENLLEPNCVIGIEAAERLESLLRSISEAIAGREGS